MTDRSTADAMTAARTAPAADDAELGRLDDAMVRLIPALERYLAAHASASFPAYPPGAVVSEPGHLPEDGVGLDGLPSSTVVGGAFALRACFINPRTTTREVTGLVEAVVRFGDELTASG